MKKRAENNFAETKEYDKPLCHKAIFYVSGGQKRPPSACAFMLIWQNRRFPLAVCVNLVFQAKRRATAPILLRVCAGWTFLSPVAYHLRQIFVRSGSFETTRYMTDGRHLRHVNIRHMGNEISCRETALSKMFLSIVNKGYILLRSKFFPLSVDPLSKVVCAHRKESK